MLWLGASLSLASPGDLPDMAALPAARERDRPHVLALSLRLRAVRVPRRVLDRWFLDDTDPQWAWTGPRPDVAGTGLGLDYAIAGRSGSWVAYGEYVDAAIPAGYWDDRDDPVDPLDGRFVDPANGFGVVAVGIDHHRHLHLVGPDGPVGVALVVGGGLGVAIPVGRIAQWQRDESGVPAYQQYLEGRDPDPSLRVPRWLPVFDATVGVRLTFAEQVVWRLEGGLHTGLFYGTSLGVVF